MRHPLGVEVFTSKGLIWCSYMGSIKPTWALYEHNTRKVILTFDSFKSCIEYIYPKHIEYHRNPTPYELKCGYGATHYSTFNPLVCVSPSGKLKSWIVSPYDGLRYYR